MGKCPLCGESTNKPNTRLIKESCGHSKCRFCLINEESGCSICEGNNGDISCRLESIGNFDYHLPATTVPNYEELHSTPRKLDFNKIPDDFIDCPIDVGKLAIDNSINQNSDNVVANIPGPQKVDIGTETESIVADKNAQSQTIQENTHSSLSLVTQTPTQPVTKVPEVFANIVSNNHQPHQETSVVQNANLIPVTQRADGRQFITIAFIANNSPNKNQQVVTPLLNQCLPSLTNVTAVQRPGGNQCIPMLGNISALQSGNQFIIRSPNIVQNLVGNQSMPVIGNLNAMQNSSGNQTLSIVGSLSAVKNLAGNQSLSPLPTINSLQSPSKGQSSPATGSPNVNHKVVGNHLHQVTQAVPKEVEEQSAPIQENANTAQKQVRTRGLPRIKTVKNVNIVQKSETNQSDKVNSQINKSPVQAVKGKRRRKELPVYLIPRKPNEQKKTPPMNSPPTKSSPMKSSLQVVGCMSPEFKLEDYLLFNRQQNASDIKDSEIQTETINHTQMMNKPSETVINETPIVSDQFNGTVTEEKFIENKVDISEQEDKAPNDKTNDEASTKDVSIEIDECKEHQDLNVIFNIRDENKPILNEKVEDEKEKMKIPSAEASSKDEYQNLDALFDIIEKESKKLNGGMFDKEEKSDLDEENGFVYEENQKLHDKMDNAKDANHMLNQEDNIVGEKDQNLNNGICDEHSEDQHLNLGMDSQNKEIENPNEGIGCNNEENKNSHEICCNQEQNLIEELPIQNGAIELLNGETGCKDENHHILDTEVKDHQEESKILDNTTDSPLVNDEVGKEAEIQSLDEKIVGVEKESENQANEDASLQEENDQHLDGGVMTEEEDTNENGINDDQGNCPYVHEKIGDEDKNNQALYEDISDEEKDTRELNHENEELQTPTAENNDEHLNENAVEATSQISNRDSVDQDEETNHNLTMQTHEEENRSAPLEINKDLSASKTNDEDNGELDSTSQKEESGIVKKPRGRPKKSLHNHEQTCKPEISHENEQSIGVEKHNKNVDTEVDSIGVDESFVLETHTDEDEIMHENVKANSTFAETKQSKDEKPDATTENAQSIVVKQRRGRKKKSFNDYELDSKPQSSNKNEQSIVKKPRGRPKKSLSNAEQPNKPNDTQETEQPVVRKLPSFSLKDPNEEIHDQSFEESESQVLEVNVQIHNQEIDKNSALNIHDKEDSTNLACVAKKPRGRPKSKNVEQEILQPDVDAISAFIEEDEPAVQKPDTVKENEYSTVIKKARGRPKKSISTSEQNLSGVNVESTVKKPRGRPRKSLTNFEQHNESNVSQENEISFVRESNNEEESKEHHEKDEGEESQVLSREDFSQDEATQDSRIDMDDGDKESLHPDVTTNLTFSDKSDSDARKPIIANGNETSMVAKIPRGRPKINAEPTVVKKQRGRPRKSLTNSEQHNESNVSQENEISYVRESNNEEESKEHHEKDEGEESQVLSREDFSQDEATQDSRIDMDDGDKESLHPDVTTNLTFSDKSDSDARKPIIANGNETSMVAKKPRGRPKINAEPTVVKKPRGRPKKSLSNVEQHNESNIPQETEIANLCEAIINDEESKEQHKTDKIEENQIDETFQDSTMDMDDGEKESPLSNDITNSTCGNKNESDANNSVNESSIITKKPRGRPKKSLTNSEQPSQPDVSDVSVEPPTVVKKSKGRPKKSISIFEQHQLASRETELSKTTEISSEKVNDEEGNEQREAEGNQDPNREDFETSKNSIVDVNDGKKESLHSDVIASSISSDNTGSDDKAPSILNENEKAAVIKKPLGRPKKSLNSSNSVTSDVDARASIVVKKSRGRPKKSLSNLEQPNVPTKSDLNEDKEEDQARCFNGAIDKEERELPDTRIDSHDDKLQSLSTSLHTEADESSILETEVNESSNQNPVDDKLETTCQSEQIAVVRKARGRPKKLKLREPIEKRPRGRPKKANYEQPNESNFSQNKETKLPSFRTDYSDEKDEQKGLDGKVVEEESRVLNGENDDLEESSQMETLVEANKSSPDENENETIDHQEQENDLVPNEDDQMKVASTSSEESAESKIQQQNCNQVSNDEGESHVLQKDTNEAEEQDSQNSKAQDDENKENKKEYSEKDDTQIENITPVTEEQDLEKPNQVDDEVPKTNNTGKKYKKFDAMNAQVIVESSKRKRKPKVLLYENEDLEISPLKKKKKELNKSSCKNDGKTTDKKSLDKTQVDNESSMNTKQNTESTEITVKKVKENESTTSVEKMELSRDENTMDTETSESNVTTTVSSPKDEDTKSLKRNRRPKTLLYENEDLKITPKGIKKKKVEFSLPSGKDSLDSSNTEKDDGTREGNNLEVFTNDDELPTTAKKSERVRKPKTLLYENKRLAFAPVKEKDVKSEIEKEDLLIMKRFEIKLEPIVVLERNVDLDIIKKYDPDDNSLHIVHERQETTRPKKSKPTVVVKRPRGRPKLSNEPAAPKSKSTSFKVLGSKYKKLKLGKEKRGPGRPSKDHSHIITLPGEPSTYQCIVCSKSFKHYSNRTLHASCARRAPNSPMKSYKCEICPRKFDHKTHWEYHERMHKGDKPFRCDLCGKKFLQKSKLNRHLLIHQYTQNLECNECGKKFVSKEYLKSHLLSHVKSSFVFRCNQCPKSFTMDSNRRRHELSHSPVAVFKCLHCPKSFKTKFEVNKHAKIHQKARPFACDVCGKAFLTKSELKRHSLAHTGEKKYTCSYCQQHFGRLDNYSRHVLHHHTIEQHQIFLPEHTSSSPPEASEETVSDEEIQQEKKKDKSAVKPKKISRTSSNPVPMPISFVQPLTPQSAPSPYSISQNHELASVIHETLPDLNNAVPVISAPISAQPSLMDPIPLEQALVLNRQIEEKIYTQSSFCEFPGLTRRVNVTVVNRSQFGRRNSSDSNSNSNDGTKFLTMNQEQTAEQHDDNEMSPAKKDIHVHWRRRTAETFKSRLDQNK